MSQIPYDDKNPYSQPPGPPERSGGSTILTCLIVCLVVILLVAIACGGAAWWAVSSAKRLATDAVKTGIQNVINDSELTPEDKAAVNAQIDRVAEAFKRGDITMEDMADIMTNLGESPLFVLAIVEAVGNTYIEQSELTDEEKEDAKRTLQRVARGVAEEKIDQYQLEQALDELMVTDPDGQKTLKSADEVTTEELKLAIANCKQLADDAEIPDEEFKLNIGEEFKKAVDDALNKN